MNNYFKLWLILLLVVTPSTLLASPDWDDSKGGATREYYNIAAMLPWDRVLGDWRDINNEAWGERPYTSLDIPITSAGETVSIDVTKLVAQWYQMDVPNNGFYLKLDKNTFLINSREAAQNPPQLEVFLGNSKHQLIAAHDTYRDKSTYKSLGSHSSLKISRSIPALLWFDLSDLPRGDNVKVAKLELFVNKTYGSGNAHLRVFQIDPAPVSSPVAEIQSGLAGGFNCDKRVEEHHEVYFATGFDEAGWKRDWYIGGRSGTAGLHTTRDNYRSLDGKSLRALIPSKKNLGLDLRYRFAKHDFPEPVEAYFRYYLRLGNDWNQTVSGGKLPGFAGTYGKAGWGGRRPTGYDGWSARGGFLKTLQATGSEGKLRTPIGSYVYHLDHKSFYGNTWTWARSGGALLENNRWYGVEQYIKLNDPGENNGIFRAWLDGRLVFERDKLRFRETTDLKIQEVWFNLYHGGVAPSPTDQPIYIDNVVVASSYIGPMNCDSNQIDNIRQATP